MNKDLKELKAEARSMQLVYVSSDLPGYSRVIKGKSTLFYDTNNKVIKDPEILNRLHGLVLPPAWTNLWICTQANGHLQAIGIDQKGRKQYRYHSSWSLKRNERKHNRMLEFGEAIPSLRKQIEKDLRKKTFTKEKVVALALKMLENTLIRIGNTFYTKQYGSFGLTTLKNKHIKVNGSHLKISFKGKKGIFHEVDLSQKNLVNLVKKLKDLPGQELFQYYEQWGEKRTIDSGMINEYIRQYTGKDFTAKDFRTWSGTLNALKFLSGLEKFSTITEAKRNINATLDYVASQLGNTRTVCRKYYVHPELLLAYENGSLYPFTKKLIHQTNNKSNSLAISEKILLSFLRKIDKPSK
ncbi:DNA topoisomerase IB [Solitalea sp. MAHUQ-68]|uniref:DNA topoisomerase n=1 Tax=Solitalea agri TaxID=2953739 RepID=A0A9X2JDY8_9SPHI|nr:DNA topoisomerase IB [Solitalea agri]MCO4294638.1 DNA topoisomerase IB [Solitalea agri]